ncbi:hypothetical protein GCM10027048_28060 [Hymenobacter coalescens]
MAKLSYDPLFLYDATAPYVPLTRKRIKRHAKACKKTALLNWLAIGGIVAALLLTSCATKPHFEGQKRRHRTPSWAQQDARHEQAR